MLDSWESHELMIDVGSRRTRTYDPGEQTRCCLASLLVMQKSTQWLIGLFDLNHRPALEFEHDGEGEKQFTIFITPCKVHQMLREPAVF